MGEDFCIEELQIWKVTRRLIKEVYRCCPEIKDEPFNTYLRRAAIAVLCNIAEGHLRPASEEFRVCLHRACRNCEEMLEMVSFPEAGNCLEKEVVDNLRFLCEEMISEIRRVLEDQEHWRKRLTFNDEI